jgi:hypothetical protein
MMRARGGRLIVGGVNLAAMLKISLISGGCCSENLIGTAAPPLRCTIV